MLDLECMYCSIYNRKLIEMLGYIRFVQDHGLRISEYLKVVGSLR